MSWVRVPVLVVTVAYVVCKVVSAVLNGFATRVGEQAAQEGLDRTPALAEWIVKASVRLLPTEHRDRYLKEWLAELDWKRRLQVSFGCKGKRDPSYRIVRLSCHFPADPEESRLPARL